MILSCIKKIVFILIMVLFYAKAFALVSIDDSFYSQYVGANLYLYEDQGKVLTVEDVMLLELSSTEKVEHAIPSLGYTNSRYWGQFDILDTSSQPTIRYLQLETPLVDNFTLYMKNSQGDFSIVSAGREVMPRDSDHYSGRFITFPINLESGDITTLYFSIESEDALEVPLKLMSESALRKSSVVDAVWLALYFGIMVSMMIFAFLLLILLKENLYIYYILLVVMHHIAFFFCLNGLPNVFESDLWVFQQSGWTKGAIVILMSMSMFMFVLFYSAFVKNQSDRVYLLKTIDIFLPILSVVALIGAILLPYSLSVAIVSAITAVTFVFIGLSAVGSLFKGHEEMPFFLFAWSVAIIGGAIYTLKNLAILPVNIYTTHAWQLGAAIEAVLISCALARRVEFERVARRLAHQKAIEHERDANRATDQLYRAEKAMKEEMETKVRERTEDLSKLLAEVEKTNSELSELSINDGLTGVRNRRFFDDRYADLWSKGKQQSSNIAIIMSDIDHFKSVNDNYGHAMGDQCLRVIGHILKTFSSKHGYEACRYGGEEFIIICADASIKQVVMLAERIREKIEESQIELAGKSLMVTASFGVASEIPSVASSPLQLIEACDKALYNSKRSGRNKVSAAAPIRAKARKKPPSPDSQTSVAAS